MGDLKAKPTFYNGYLFRSKLEAKWAVFLDLLGVPYEYESDAFECADGSQYTPDFYLPKSYLRGKPHGLGLHLEIKPVDWDEDREYIYRISSAFYDQGNLALLCGDPFDVYCEVNRIANQHLSPQYDRDMAMMHCRACRIFKVDHGIRSNYKCPCCGEPSADVLQEASKARAYRFEFYRIKKAPDHA